MIYSPDHNFLLLKNRKVGGSSLEVSLSRVLPKNAIVTPLNGSGNIWDSKPKNHNERNYDDYFYNHIKYEEVNKKINLSNVKSYVFVRHPYDSVLSDFFHRLFFFKKDLVWLKLSKFEKEELVEQYFDNKFYRWYKGDKGIYTINDKIVVDKILYYEKGIEKEINSVLNFHKISNITLNVFEKAHRPKSIKYQDVFLKKHLDLIRKEWWWEFENLNYQP